MGVPARLAAGEVLYRDVGYYFGPLPPVLDSLALRVFGHDFDVLLALRVAVSLLAVEALRRLALRLAPDARVSACAAAFAVAACAFGLGGAWPFPYSVAALEGMTALWWALEIALAGRSRVSLAAAALLGAFGAGTKIELLPVAIAVLGFAFFTRRPWNEAVAATLAVAILGGVPFVLPVLLFGRATLESHGFLIAFHTPTAWKNLYTGAVLFGGNSSEAMRAGAWRQVILPSAPLVALAVALSFLRSVSPVLLGALGAAFGAASVFVWRNEELHVLLPLAAVLAVAEGIRWLAGGATARADAGRTARVAISLLALAAVFRMPLFLRNQIYGAFAAPLALVVAIAAFARISRSRAFVTGLAAGLAFAQSYDRLVEYRNRPWVDVKLPGARLYLPPEEASLVTKMDASIRELSRPGGFVFVFPEPGFLLFTTRRRSPFVDEQFHPQHQDARGEEEMIAAFRATPPDIVFVTNRAFSEFGRFGFGDGILDRFSPEFRARYVEAGRIGGPQRQLTRERRVTEASVWVPADRRPASVP